MKIPRKILCLVASALGAAALWQGGRLLAEDEPVIAITRTGTNQFEIQIVTNGLSDGFYELYHTPVLGDPAYPWTLLIMGTQGQTNFVVQDDPNMTAFFFIGVGNDWDGDGIENYRDADPKNAHLGQLAITIDSPEDGETIN
jgi:hypothetical protein